MTTTAMSKTEKTLNRAWTKAAKAGDIATLQILRPIMEGEGLGILVKAKITPRTAERLHDMDTVERQENPVRFVIAGVCYWPSWDEATEDADNLEDESMIEEQIMFAQMNVYTDLTQAQEDMLERSVTKSMKNAAKEIRAAILRTKQAY